jgi:hypothetical protein
MDFFTLETAGINGFVYFFISQKAREIMHFAVTQNPLQRICQTALTEPPMRTARMYLSLIRRRIFFSLVTVCNKGIGIEAF